MIIQEIRAALLQRGRKAEERIGTRYYEGVIRQNAEYLRTVMFLYGWPTSELAGEDGANAALDIAARADYDVAFQRKCLESMCESNPTEIGQHAITRLTDRIRANEERIARESSALGLPNNLIA